MDAYLAAKAHAAIFEGFPGAEVKCKNAVVSVKMETVLSMENEAVDKIKRALGGITDIKEVRVTVVPFDTAD